MKIPLLATERAGKRNYDKIMLVQNGEVKYVPRPFKPYVLIPTDTSVPHISDKKWDFHYMETGESMEAMQFEFDDYKEAMEFYRRVREVEPRALSARFLEQIFIDSPDFFLDYPNTNKLKILAFDLEVITYGTGVFPTPKKNPIIAIGCQVLGEDPVVFMDYDKKLNDYNILKSFIKYVQEVDPDIIVGYNSKAFDLPYLWDRIQIVNKKRNIPEKLDPRDITRTNRDFKQVSNFSTIWDLGGRIHLDLLDEVWKDQKLLGLKNRKLKTVAKHFGIDVIEIEDLIAETHKIVNKPELHDYVASDAYATIELTKVYLPNLISLAEFMQVPLASCVDTYNSFASKIFHARHLREMCLYPALPNIDRYKDNLVLTDEGTLRYEGAVVKINNNCPDCGSRIIYLRCCGCGKHFNEDEGLSPGRLEQAHKIDFACVDDQTELLTETGWKLFKDVKEGEICANFDPDTGHISWHPIDHTMEYDGPKEMIQIKNRSTDQLLTPNHRVLYARGRSARTKKNKKRYKDYLPPGVFTTKRADSIPTYIKIPVAGTRAGSLRALSPKEYHEHYLIGIIAAEGWKTGQKVHISQTNRNPEVVEKIRRSLAVVDSSAKENSRERENNNGKYTEYKWTLSFEIPGDIHKLPDAYLKAPNHVLSAVFEGLMDGDGHWETETSGTYASKRKELAEQVQIIAIQLGIRAAIGYAEKYGMYYVYLVRDQYVHLGLNRRFPIKDKLIQKVPYSGKVYCVSTHTGFMVCRRNGKPFITGNSMYPATIMTFNLSPETTRIVEWRDYNPEFIFKREEDAIWIQIPDANFNKSIVVKIDMTKEGFLPRELRWMKKERIKLKTAKKKAAQKDKKKCETQQYAYKVIMNITYGYNGLTYCRYGDLAVALATVGLARWMTLNVENWLGRSVVEIDSVTGDTPIYVRDTTTKQISIIPIEDLHTDLEKKRIPYTGQYEVLSRNGWTKINYTKRHPVSKPIHRVKVSDGYVDLTVDHSLFREDKTEVSPANLHVGDSIELTSIPETSNLYNFSRFHLTEDTAWTLGLFLAEGSISHQNNKKEKYNISISMQDKTILQKVVDIFNRDFASHCKAKNRTKLPELKIYDTTESSSTFRATGFYNSVAYNFFRDLCYGSNGEYKVVPREILNCNNPGIIQSFINGYMDGDGYITITSGRGQAVATSVDKCLAAGIRFLNRKLGSKTRVSIRKDKTNVTAIYLRHKHLGVHKKIEKNKVSQNYIINENYPTQIPVYDIATNDGTFVTALGEIVLHNTDGLILDEWEEGKHEKLNNALSVLIKQIFGVKSYMELEYEDLGSAYFYRSKNYILKDKEGKITFHGVSFKSSRHSEIYDRAVNLISNSILDGKTNIWPVIKDALDISKCSLRDFIMRMKFSKSLDNYKSENCIQKQLGKQCKEAEGYTPGIGTQLEYAICKEEPKNRLLSQIPDISAIDYDYYIEDVHKALALFGISIPKSVNPIFLELFEVGEEESG